MTSINLTKTGPSLSRIVLGMMHLNRWQLSRAELIELVNRCLDMGVTTFDHADIYGDYTCEELFGPVLAQNPSLRAKMQLVTKCGIKLISQNRPAHTIKHYDTGQAHLVASVENSLKVLKTDYLDLFLIHRPDPLMDVEDTAAGLTAVKEAGKVLHVGVSNFNPAQFELLASRLDFPLVTNQVEFSVLHLDSLRDGTFAQCQRLGLAPMAWSPLGGGRFFHEDSQQAARLRETLGRIGAELGGAKLDQVALAWILNHPAKILPVIGTGKLERIQRAVAAEALPLSREQWFAIWQASTGHEVP